MIPTIHVWEAIAMLPLAKLPPIGFSIMAAAILVAGTVAQGAMLDGAHTSYPVGSFDIGPGGVPSIELPRYGSVSQSDGGLSSSNVTPEPSTAILAAVGAGVLTLTRRK